ncbi:MAG TPA: PKD domain-containing protein [Bacteroidia bacterium]|jgi:gliding motility-associated-like protein
MELGPNNIEQLFRSSFEDYSPEVDPKVWNKIQHSINKPGKGSFFSSLAGKLVLGTAAVTVITVSTILLLNTNTSTPPVQDKTTAQNNPVNPVKSTSSTQNSSSNTVTDNNVKHDSKVSNTNTLTDTKNKPVDNPNKDTQVQNNNPNNNQTVNNNPVPNNNKTTDPQKDEHSNNNPNVNAPSNNNQNPKKDDNATGNNGNNNPVNQDDQQNNGAKMPLAKISFSAQASADGKVYAPVAVTFSNKYKASTLEWNFGDGAFTTSELNPVHIFENPGEYTITLIATAENGRIEKDSIKIRILVNAFFIPNTFTPNGDGNNDVYRVIKNEKYPYELSHVEVVIFDRTNQKVGAFTDGGSWDGHNFKTGEMCPQGTYLVLIKYTSSEDGKSQQQIGSVFLKE